MTINSRLVPAAELPSSTRSCRSLGKSKQRKDLLAGRRRTRFLSLESLEDRNLLAQLTVITHGRMDQIFDTPNVAPEWAFDLASAINAAEYSGQNTQSQINNSVVRYDASSLGVPAGGSSDFLIYNRLAVRDTIFDDNVVDELIGGPSLDWFAATVDGRRKDLIRDLALGEILDDLR